MNHHWIDKLSEDTLASYFPYPRQRSAQKQMLEKIVEHKSSVTFEAGVGTGKTAVGYTVAKCAQSISGGQVFYIAPNKTLVNQIKMMHPDVHIVYGRNEYPCLYYTDKEVTAEESPCSLLDCPHRVNQETGETEAVAVKPCPYYQAKYEAKQNRIVACTFAFYFFTDFFSHEWEDLECLIIDEVHNMPRVIRNCLSYEITDNHLQKGIDFLEENQIEEAKPLKLFLRAVKKIAAKRQGPLERLVDNDDIRKLMTHLEKINISDFDKRLKMIARNLNLGSSEEERQVLKKVETVARDLNRYYRSLKYSKESKDQHALNFIYGELEKNPEDEKDAKFKLVVKSYYVRSIIERILPDFTIAYSGTIGDPQILEFESGIDFPFYPVSGNFRANNMRVYLPNDTPDLSMNKRSRRDLPKILRRIARSCKDLSEHGKRSLVVVVSNVERDKFLQMCAEESVNAISYGNGVTSRAAAERFINGEADCLVGTSANYAEGVDLPKGIAPVIFHLRPSYPNPTSPTTQFEEKRFRGRRWQLWNWRVMQEALQVRGRNLRSVSDVGVTIFVSQQFRRFLFSALPDDLKKTYKGNLSMEEAIKESLEILK